MIREARPEDIPDIVLLGEKFFEESGWGEIADYDYNSVIRLAAKAIKEENYGIFIAEDTEVIGMVAGIMLPLHFNENHLVCQEFLWYFESSTRGRRAGLLLFEALVDWAKNAGANSFITGAIENMNPEKLSKFYERKGFKPSERNYIKKFGD